MAKKVTPTTLRINAIRKEVEERKLAVGIEISKLKRRKEQLLRDHGEAFKEIEEINSRLTNYEYVFECLEGAESLLSAAKETEELIRETSGTSKPPALTPVVVNETNETVTGDKDFGADIPQAAEAACDVHVNTGDVIDEDDGTERATYTTAEIEEMLASLSDEEKQELLGLDKADAA